MVSLEEIERAIEDGSLHGLNRETLEEFSRFQPRPSGNPSYHGRCERAQLWVAHALERLHNKEREAEAMKRHGEIRERLEGLRKPHWAVLWFTVLGAIAATAAAVLSWLMYRP